MSAPTVAKPDAMRPILEADAEAAREQAAQALLNIETVKVELLAAAKGGLRVCIFRPALPVNLKGTEAADALEAWAAKEGLTVDWGQPETVTEGGFDIGQRVAVAVRWDAPRLVVSGSEIGAAS